MGLVILQILQWILRIIVFLLFLILGLSAIVLIVPIRYQACGELLEKKPQIKGKITWFFYLIYMKFCYEKEFHIQIRVFGWKVFDSEKKSQEAEKTEENEQVKNENRTEEAEESLRHLEEADGSSQLQMRETLMPAEEDAVEEKIDYTRDKGQQEDSSEEEAFKLPLFLRQATMEETETTKENTQEVLQEIPEFMQNFQEEAEEEKVSKKTLWEKIEDLKLKMQEFIQKIKDIIDKIRKGKLKVEHYLELWNAEATQITFKRAKKKLAKMIKAILPRKWKVTGELGFDNPCTTGQVMGVLGALYPVFGNKVQMVPDFENEIIHLEGNMKGHIRLGNLLYQVISLLLNRHCFKFIKTIFNEINSSKK